MNLRAHSRRRSLVCRRTSRRVGRRVSTDKCLYGWRRVGRPPEAASGGPAGGLYNQLRQHGDHHAYPIRHPQGTAFPLYNAVSSVPQLAALSRTTCVHNIVHAISGKRRNHDCLQTKQRIPAQRHIAALSRPTSKIMHPTAPVDNGNQLVIGPRLRRVTTACLDAAGGPQELARHAV